MISFFKAPKAVLKAIISIQVRILWQGDKEKKGISWAIWKMVCKAENEGGLSVKDISLFNSALSKIEVEVSQRLGSDLEEFSGV